MEYCKKILKNIIRTAQKEIITERAGVTYENRTALKSAPGGARFQQVQVLNSPGSGKDIAESKGIHREVESEGSWMWGTY